MTRTQRIRKARELIYSAGTELWRAETELDPAAPERAITCLEAAIRLIREERDG